MVKTFDDKNLIRPHMFVELVDDSLESDGLYFGDVFYVANMKGMPFDPSDVYLQRIYAMVHKHLGNGEVDTTQILVVDPRNFQQLSNGKHKKLLEKFRHRYAN